MDGLQFVWDSEKAEKNYRKHGIDFETAKFVFGDENRIEIYDEQHSGDEERYKVIGMAHKLLFVVYTERKKYIRIISARLATRSKRSVYYDGDFNTP